MLSTSSLMHYHRNLFCTLHETRNTRARISCQVKFAVVNFAVGNFAETPGFLW